MTQIRLIPILLFALSSLLVLKVLDFLDRGGLRMEGTAVAQAEEATGSISAGPNANFGKVLTDVRKSKQSLPVKATSDGSEALITGSSDAAKPADRPIASRLGELPISQDEKNRADAERAAAAGGSEVAQADGGQPVPDAAEVPPTEAPPADTPPADAAEAADAPPAADATQGDAAGQSAPPSAGVAEPLVGNSASGSERALLERLQDRRRQLDDRDRELEMRENLLRAAEKRIEERINELKQMEASVGAAEEKRAEDEKARMKGLVDMYAAMKPKDAARIFDTLDTSLLVEVAAAMKPATMAPILAAMSKEAAARLTVALANKDRQPAAAAQASQSLDLPKIEGVAPTAN